MSNGSLYTHIESSGIAIVEFFHPASNSLPSELLQRITKSFNELSENDDVKVIILKSETDKVFCAGASFDELISISNFEEGKEFFMGFANVINSMRKCSKIIIGRSQGKAVGGGVGLLSACDYCFATEKSSIKLSELTIGIGPFVIEPVVSRKIGIAAFSEMTLDATHWKTAYWAKEKGLFAHVYETISDMDKEIDGFAYKISKYNPEALSELKKILWQGADNWDNLLEKRAEISGNLVLSEFTKNALKKFKP